MKIPDRELALSMMYMDQVDREMILSNVSREKSRRVAEELSLHEHLRIRYDQYRRAAERVIVQLTGAQESSDRSSNIRDRTIDRTGPQAPDTSRGAGGRPAQSAPLCSYLRPIRARRRDSGG